MKRNDMTDERLDLHHRYVVAAATSATRAKRYATVALLVALVALAVSLVHVV